MGGEVFKIQKTLYYVNSHYGCEKTEICTIALYCGIYSYEVETLTSSHRNIFSINQVISLFFFYKKNIEWNFYIGGKNEPSHK